MTCAYCRLFSRRQSTGEKNQIGKTILLKKRREPVVDPLARTAQADLRRTRTRPPNRTLDVVAVGRPNSPTAHIASDGSLGGWPGRAGRCDTQGARTNVRSCASSSVFFFVLHHQKKKKTASTNIVFIIIIIHRSYSLNLIILLNCSCNFFFAVRFSSRWHSVKFHYFRPLSRHQNVKNSIWPGFRRLDFV